MAFFVSDDLRTYERRSEKRPPRKAAATKARAAHERRELVGEPVAAVGDPPAEGEDGEGGDDSPDEGEGEVGDQSESGEE